jgi:hypothetical protein
VSAMAEPDKTELMPPDAKSRQRSRNTAIAWGLVFLIVLFYLITLFKMGGNVLNKGL